MNKGIPDQLMEAALEDAASSGENELIEKLIRKKLRLPSEPTENEISEPTENEIEKCKAYLYRQGFKMSDILKSLHKYGL